MLTKHLNSKILFILILFFFTANCFSVARGNLQDNTVKRINEMTEKITSKILLTDAQKDKVKLILADYFTKLQNPTGDGNKLTELRNSSETKIIAILDSKQKMKFEIIKDEWWGLASQ